MTERAPRDRCRLPAPSRCLDGRVATSVATAARIAAADSGLPRGRRALSGTLHTDAQVCATQPAEQRLQSTSLVPRPDSPPTVSSDERVVPRTASPDRPPRAEDPNQEDHQKKPPRLREDHKLTKTDPLSEERGDTTKTTRRPRAAQDRPTLKRTRRNHQDHEKNTS